MISFNRVLAGVMLLASCSPSSGAALRGETRLHRDGAIDWVERTVGDFDTALSVTARIQLAEDESGAGSANGVVCHTEQTQTWTHYMVYERRAANESWGLYGLDGAKNGMTMPLPFDPSSIRYADRSPSQILTDFLLELGATQEEAAGFLESYSSEIFGAGLRVIFALDSGRAPDIRAAYLLGSDRPFILSIELTPTE